MELNLTPEQESQLVRIASHNGIDAEKLVKGAILQLVEQDAHFRAAVRIGIEQADRGELLPHMEVVSRIERLLQPRPKSAAVRRSPGNLQEVRG